MSVAVCVWDAQSLPQLSSTALVVKSRGIGESMPGFESQCLQLVGALNELINTKVGWPYNLSSDPGNLRAKEGSNDNFMNWDCLCKWGHEVGPYVPIECWELDLTQSLLNNYCSKCCRSFNPTLPTKTLWGRYYYYTFLYMGRVKK